MITEELQPFVLRREGWPVKHKRAERIWRPEGRKIPPKTAQTKEAPAKLIALIV